MTAALSLYAGAYLGEIWRGALQAVPAGQIEAAEAVTLGRRTAVLRTNTSTPGPSAALLRSHAAAQSRALEVTAVVRPDAYQALFAGDRDRHDAIVTEAALAVAPAADVIVLAQASLAHLQPALARDTGRPVLSSPPLLMQEIGRRLDGSP